MNNLERAGSAAVPSSETDGAVAPSCYRVSVLSGSLEISARLKSVDDLELLMKVLEANRCLFAQAERAATETVLKATEISAKADGSATNGFAKTEQETKTSARVDRLANAIDGV